ncbi:MAG: chemotaxis protein CheD [Candidatus Cloacimonetes bacterium]|nr:chemotaxis protein CheD [Candidatus Cloacimonadota bacterium]
MTNFALSEQTYLMRPGYIMLHRDKHMVYGVLGSGVFVGLYDSRNHYSGCCSFQLPRSQNTRDTARYGEQALRWLINRMQHEGSESGDLRAHVIGGGVQADNAFGEKNIHVAMEVLHELDVAVESTDTGGHMGRKYVYNTATGESMIMKVHEIRSRDWFPYN